jgi:CRP-like cAMP-binding protein
MKGRGESDSELLTFLCSLPLFAYLDQPSARALAAACRLRRLSKGEILFFHSEPGDSVYIVRSGEVSIVLNSPDGREMVIDEMHPGEILGELGLLTGKPRSAGAIARVNTELLVIPPQVFLQLMEKEPRLQRLILDITAGRLQKSTKRQMDLAFMNAHARLARTLLALEEEQRDIGYITVSQEELARSTGLIRQTVAKALGEWRRSGWLLTGRGRIVILNRKALEKVEMGVMS